MDLQTRQKLLKAGYRIFRLNSLGCHGYTITEPYSDSRDLPLLHFSTKMEAWQVFKKIMEDPKCLADW